MTWVIFAFVSLKGLNMGREYVQNFKGKEQKISLAVTAVKKD